MSKISLKNYSKKQRSVFTWWKNSPHFDGIICDGAIRSGKTSCMALSFVIWASMNFHGKAFAFCGKTISSLKRNMLEELIPRLESVGFIVKNQSAKNYLDISLGSVTNRFYIFGGKDEGSSSLIQGITLAGILLDEVALMPRSFVEQAVARCSLKGSKLWFNCNPDNSFHWFKKEWIDKREQKNLLYVHFSLNDNPSLSKAVIERYKRLYSGAFYKRFVLGKWSNTAGAVYPMFCYEKNTFSVPPERFDCYAVSCDYGTVNPASFGLWGRHNGCWYRIDEYYYNSREKGLQRTDEEHYKALEKLCQGKDIDMIVCDPSAASFIECVKRHGKFKITQGKNDVISGIRKVSDALRSGKIKISVKCEDALREFSQYRWDERAGSDSPVKENDHAMDDIRYFVTHFCKENTDSFFVSSIDR
ncbi:MAG: PBSX family phage terminase large subunit [Ruminococcus sp.]|nr:PBSX family phage terminase large subunit [Ruminococcus sp.]